MTELRKKSCTRILDLDGTILLEHGNPIDQFLKKHQLLPGVLAKLNEWISANDIIILITARKESTRPHLESELRRLGVIWDHLIMGLPGGKRYLYNDKKPYDPLTPTAIAVNLNRNEGFENLPEEK